MAAEFKGYGIARTERGLASPYELAPWRLSGRVFTIWYPLADPAEAAWSGRYWASSSWA